ncbi:MAG: four helix bundle protein [Saprospiraceae bacterium]|nr:four helix bundle protein [Saprospiraceae bacterium]
MGTFRDLVVYRKAFKLAMDIFQESKNFPPEEKYSLTDQIRRSSRSVCSCIGEAYRKRKHPKHFASKLTDADSENTETQVWCDFALTCKYITKEKYDNWIAESEEVGRMLYSMIENPEKFS